MKKSFLFIILSIIIASLNAYQTRILSETPQQIQFVVKMDSLRIDTSNEFTFFNQTGMMLHPDQPGNPDLPYILYQLAVPEDGTISVSIKELNSDKLKLTKEIRPVPRYEYNTEDRLAPVYEIEKKAYQNYHQLSFETEGAYNYREYRLVPVKLFPLQYSLNTKTLHILKEMLVTVQINGSVNQKQSPKSNWDTFYSSLILNWKTGQNFVRSVGKSTVNYSPFSESAYWYSFEINTDGIYRINASQISGVSLGDIDPDKLRIFSTGGASMSSYPSHQGYPFEEIPIRVVGGEDGSFDSGDYILLYARDRDGFGMNTEFSYDRINKGDFYYYNPYSGQNKYWLTWGEFDAPAKRIQTQSAVNSVDETQNSVLFKQHIESERARMNEKNEWYYAWYSQKMEGKDNASYLFSFNVDDLDLSKPKSLNTYLKTELSASSNVNYKVNLSLNDVFFKTHTWTTAGLQNINSSISNLIEGQNKLQIDVIRTVWSDLYLDFYDVIYYKKLIKRNQMYHFVLNKDELTKQVKYQFLNKPAEDVMVFRVSAFNQVALINPEYQSSTFSFNTVASANDEFFVIQEADIKPVSSIQQEIVKDLSSDNSQVDYVIVCPKSLESSAEELKQIYEQYHQVNVRVVTQEDIMNQFNGGNEDPIAIRNYLKYVYQNSPEPKIKGLTLFGAGTIDWRNYSGMANAKKMIMNLFIYSESNTGGTFTTKTSSDQYFSYLNTTKSPELTTGRIPVTSNSDWQIYKNKLISYYENKHGQWTNKALMLADDYIYRTIITDTSHTINVSNIAASLHPSVSKDLIYAQEFPINEFKKKPEVNDLYVSKINQGALFAIYMGHGDPVTIGDENYLRVEDMSRLNNLKNMPVLFLGSCSSGRTDNPNIKSISEYMMMNPTGGSIASIAGMRDTYGGANELLITNILNGSFNQRLLLGESFLLACQNPLLTEFNTFTYQLLGDPLLPAIPPERLSQITLSADTTASDMSFQARQTVQVEGDYNHLFNGETEVNVYDSERTYSISNSQTSVTVKSEGKHLFTGKSTLNNGVFNASFIVPDDIVGGNNGKVVAYHLDQNNLKDYVNYISNIEFAGHEYVADNPDVPQINIYLDNRKFREGDQVSQNPLLIADMTDSNGINILGASGHEIVLLLDDSTEPVVVTQGFSYDLDSHTKGTLYWQLNHLEEGNHTLRLIAFDNFNRPSVKTIDFKVAKNADIQLTDLLVYPNPIKKDGWFTFHITEDAYVDIKVYTITGRKIKDIKAGLCSSGYNQIFWDGRDEEGDRLANNTYFYKITAKQVSNSKKTEKTDKLIILK